MGATVCETSPPAAIMVPTGSVVVWQMSHQLANCQPSSPPSPQHNNNSHPLNTTAVITLLQQQQISTHSAKTILTLLKQLQLSSFFSNSRFSTLSEAVIIRFRNSSFLSVLQHQLPLFTISATAFLAPFVNCNYHFSATAILLSYCNSRNSRSNPFHNSSSHSFSQQ